MANSVADARGSEQEIHRKLIQARAVDVMIAVGPNFFYTVTLPCTLWFFDRAKSTTARKDQVLFIIGSTVDRIPLTDADLSPLLNGVQWKKPRSQN